MFAKSESNQKSWLRSRGYLHVTPQINVYQKEEEILSKLNNKKFIARHGFFPLIHTILKERKYKAHPNNRNIRGHKLLIDGKLKRSEKPRPLHYSTHIDSLIFGYYSEIITELFEAELKKSNDGLEDCIIAYRRIPLTVNSKGEKKGKSTIHFANEVFEEIKMRAGRYDDCAVLMFDIKSFFSQINHEKLKEAWCKLLNVDRLPEDHFNVFKACTKFSYILLDDLRISFNIKKKKTGFDEKKLSQIRRTRGVECFFESIKEFREAINNKTIKLYKHPFVKFNQPVGIPQGLPISSILANLYLLEFDKSILKEIEKYNGFYRRYSDDILIICRPGETEYFESFVKREIAKQLVEISDEKTEKFLFRKFTFSLKKNRLTSIKILKDRCKIGVPLTYLGFEFYGYKKLIKSANLAKFYRRMIYEVKKKAKRALALSSRNLTHPVIFKSRLKKLYKNRNLSLSDIYIKRKRIIRDDFGNFKYSSKKIKQRYNSNYFSYVNRASEIMEDSSIRKQLRNHKNIFYSAINKHLKQ